MKTALLTGYDDVVFDFDGTLGRLRVDWNGLRVAVAQHFPEANEPGERLGLDRLVTWVSARHGWDGRHRLAELLYRFEQPGGSPSIELIDATIACARALDHFHVISNNLVSTVAHGLALAGLADHCRVIVGFDSVLESKPSGQPYRLLCNAVRLGPRVLYVGDRESDREFSRRAGVTFLHASKLCA